MNYEIYSKQREELEGQKKLLIEQIKSLDDKYVQENSKFKIGDRIKNLNTNEFGYVCKNKLDYRGRIRTEAYKEKKDGTQGMHKMFIWAEDKIELSPKD